MLFSTQLHMTNAARVFASYFNTPEVKASTELFSMCCTSLGMLVDVLDDASALFPAWGTSSCPFVYGVIHDSIAVLHPSFLPILNFVVTFAITTLLKTSA